MGSFEIDLSNRRVNGMRALKATVRPQAVLVLVTLGDDSGRKHNLRLDLGKGIFVDHVPGAKDEDNRSRDVVDLSNEILRMLREERSSEYNADPGSETVVFSLPLNAGPAGP